MKYLILFLIIFSFQVQADECHYKIKIEQNETNFETENLTPSINESMHELHFKEGDQKPHFLNLKLIQTFDHHNARRKYALVTLTLYNDQGNLVAYTLGTGTTRRIARNAYSLNEFKKALKMAISNLAPCKNQGIN